MLEAGLQRRKRSMLLAPVILFDERHGFGPGATADGRRLAFHDIAEDRFQQRFGFVFVVRAGAHPDLTVEMVRVLDHPHLPAGLLVDTAGGFRAIHCQHGALLWIRVRSYSLVANIST